MNENAKSHRFFRWLFPFKTNDLADHTLMPRLDNGLLRFAIGSIVSADQRTG